MKEGKTQNQVAEVIGLKRAGYTAKEQGKVPITVEELCIIAEFLGADISEFFTFTDGQKLPENRAYSKEETDKLLDRYEKLIHNYTHMVDSLQNRVDKLENFISANAKNTREGDKENVNIAALRKNP